LHQAVSLSMARLLLEQDESLITSSTFKSTLDHQAYKKCRTALVCLKAAKTTHALGERSFYRITRRCIIEAKARAAGGGDDVSDLSVSCRMSHPEQLGSVHHVFGDLEGDTVTCLAFNPFHPCLLAVGTGSGTVSLFDAAAPRPVLRGLDVEHMGSVRRLCWSACTNMLLSLGSDGSAVVWYGQPDTGLQLARKIQTTKLLTGATFCPTNENFVLVLTDDGAVHTISISTGRAVQSWHASLHSSCVAWGAGGRCVYLSDDKGAIHAVPFDAVAIRVLPGNKTTMRVSSKHVGSQVHSLIVRPHIPPTPQTEDVIIAGASHSHLQRFSAKTLFK
jgi:WD40 repeat protein